MPEKIAEETRPKRDAILDAARTLFAQKGYEETTIAGIAGAAGVAVGTVYTIPLSYVQEEDIIFCITGHASWWRNLRGGAPVRIMLTILSLPGTTQKCSSSR